MITDDTIGIKHLNFDRMMAELMDCIDLLIYRKYITTDEKGCKIMYDEFLKAIYRTMDAVLLFWLKLSTELDRWRLRINWYKWCAMNINIEGKQCTILWHIYDV